MAETLNWNLSPLMRALVEGAERLGGGARERDLYQEAARTGETGHYGDDAHFAKGLRELGERGIFRTEWIGEGRYWWLTEEAWRARGHGGPAPATNQAGLF